MPISFLEKEFLQFVKQGKSTDAIQLLAANRHLEPRTWPIMDYEEEKCLRS